MRVSHRIGAVLCLLSCFSLQCAAQSQKKLTVSGKLTHAMAIGGESTGWAIQFDSETNIDGKPLHSLEVSGASEDLQHFENRQVTIKGKLIHKHGVETGDRLILKVSSIKES